MTSSSRWSVTGAAVPVVRWSAPDGVLAAVSTRAGGVSPAPFDTMNLGRSTGDAGANVDENRRRFLGALGAGGARLARIHQVHGNRILEVDASWPEARPSPEADGLLTRETGRLLVVTIADCAPVYLAEPASGTLALVHAGWRGAAAGIGARAVQLVAEHARIPPSALVAAVGPAIGPCCYEVGPEVEKALPDSIVSQGDGRRPHLDLWQANVRQLVAAGVREEAIDVAGLCTMCHPELFFSYRRDGRRSGRMIAVLGRLAAA